MRKFETIQSLVIPMDRANIDTDMIIPKQFLKSIKKTGFGPNLFDELRYLDEGQPGMDCSARPLNESFVLNQPKYQGGQILLARENFGCGSSREHAPWALDDYGFRVVISSSFADIFFNNSFKNGLLPIVLAEEAISELFDVEKSDGQLNLIVNLEAQTVSIVNGKSWSFEVDEFRKYCLINGLDDIGLTLKDSDAIKQFENEKSKISPWLF